MSDPNEPPRPPGPPSESGAGDGAPPPPFSGDNPYGAAGADAGGADYGSYGGGYAAPPPPPGSPYGSPEPSAYSPTEAIGFGWRHFQRSPSTLLVPTLVIGVVIIVLSIVIRLIFVGGMTDSGSGLGTVLLAAALASAVTGVVSQILAAALYKGGVAVADGRPLAFGQLFEGWDKAQVVVAALIIGVLTFIGTLLCYFPALVVGYFTQFTFLFIVDKHLSATDAIRASFKLCQTHLGPTILFYLLAVVCIIVGAVLCLVGLLAAVPIVLVGLAYTYRRLQGEPVVDAAPKTA